MSIDNTIDPHLAALSDWTLNPHQMKRTPGWVRFYSICK